MNSELWVEQAEEFVIARLRGEPTAELLRQCQERVLSLARAAKRAKVLQGQAMRWLSEQSPGSAG